MKIIFATGNANKMREIREILGEEKYEIHVNDAAQIVGFFEYKAACCSGMWANATSWDERYKHMEYEHLKPFFSYRNIF